MDVIAMVPRHDEASRAGRMLGLAVSRGWVAHSLRLGRREGGSRSAAVLTVAIPSGMEIAAAPADVSQYDESIVLPPPGVGKQAPWTLIQNARYGIEIDESLLGEAAAGCHGDVVGIHVSQRLRSYSESLRHSRDGRVLGFGRYYDGQSTPGPVRSDWPHLVLLTPSAVAALSRGGGMQASYEALLEHCNACGLTVRCLEVGGTAWDMATEDGLLSFFDCLRTWQPGIVGSLAAGRAAVSQGARIEGDVLFEEDVDLSDGAVVVGPSFLGEGCRVGGGVFREGLDHRAGGGSGCGGGCAQPGDTQRGGWSL